MDISFPTNRGQLVVPAVLFLTAFGFALLGLNPTFYLDDSPETITACITLGIPHPPGYPLHTLLGHFFSGLGLGRLTFRINLLSALLAASVCAVLYGFLKKQLGVSTGLAVLFSLLWITGATTYPAALSAKTGIYHLTAIFLVAILWALLAERLTLAAFLFGLSLTNHWMSMAAFLPGFGLLAYFSWKEKGFERTKTLIMPSLLVLGLSIYLLLPLRAHLNPLLNWGDSSNWHNFLFNFFRRQYLGPEGAGGPAAWFSQWWAYLRGAFWEFGGLLLLAVFGIRTMALKARSLVLGMGLAWITLILVVGFYLNLPKEQYYLIGDYTLSTHVFILIFSAWGLEAVFSSGTGRWEKWRTTVIAALAFLLVGMGTYRTLRQRQTDYTYTYDLVLNGYKGLPHNSLYFCKGDGIVFPSWYFQWVEGKRPDVAVIGVDGLPMDWVRKNLAVTHTGFKAPFSPMPLGNESISPLAQWIVNHNQDRELYFSYNQLDDGVLPAVKPVPYGLTTKGFLAGPEPALDESRADFCWNQMRLRHLNDRRFSVDPRTDHDVVKDYAVFRNTLGIFYEDKGDDTHAKINPHSKPADFLEMDHYYRKSHEEFLWAAIWDPENPQFAFNTGNSLYHMGQIQESMTWYETAIRLKKDYANAYFNWAVAANQLGQYQKAGELFEKVLELKPYYPQAKQGLDYLVQNGLYHRP